jgi:hypothetical protein
MSPVRNARGRSPAQGDEVRSARGRAVKDRRCGGAPGLQVVQRMKIGEEATKAAWLRSLTGRGMCPLKPVMREALVQSPQVSIEGRRPTHHAGGRGEASKGTAAKRSPRARGRQWRGAGTRNLRKRAIQNRISVRSSQIASFRSEGKWTRERVGKFGSLVVATSCAFSSQQRPRIETAEKVTSAPGDLREGISVSASYRLRRRKVSDSLRALTIFSPCQTSL